MIEIHGERVLLRSMTRAEFHEGRRQYVPDPLMDPEPFIYDEAAMDARYDAFQAGMETFPRAGIFLPEGTIIGEVVFKRVDREAGRCELGIMLLHDGLKGRGYGTEAFALAVRYAFDTLGLHTLYADTMGSNVRMQRVLTKLGFVCFSRLRECYDMGGRWEDRLDYRLERFSSW